MPKLLAILQVTGLTRSRRSCHVALGFCGKPCGSLMSRWGLQKMLPWRSLGGLRGTKDVEVKSRSGVIGSLKDKEFMSSCLGSRAFKSQLDLQI